MSVADVDADAIQRVLEPVWLTKPMVAQRLRGRLELILDFAHALGLRSADNPAAARRVQNLLPKVRRRKFTLPLYPIARRSVLMAELEAIESIAARALQFTFLTAVRSGEAIGASGRRST